MNELNKINRMPREIKETVIHCGPMVPGEPYWEPDFSGKSFDTEAKAVSIEEVVIAL